jgi:hypothetical protein
VVRRQLTGSFLEPGFHRIMPHGNNVGPVADGEMRPASAFCLRGVLNGGIPDEEALSIL